LERYPEVKRVSSRFGENQLGSASHIPSNPGLQEVQKEIKKQITVEKQVLNKRPQQQKQQRLLNQQRKEQRRIQPQQKKSQQLKKQQQQTQHASRQIQQQRLNPITPTPHVIVATNSDSPPQQEIRIPKAIANSNKNNNNDDGNDNFEDFEDDEELTSDEYSYLYYEQYYEELVPEHHRYETDLLKSAKFLNNINLCQI